MQTREVDTKQSDKAFKKVMTRIETLDQVFSKYIRLRDSKVYGFKRFKCISCGGLYGFDEGDCGHFVKRANMATRFNEDNCHAQCVYCNRFLAGNYDRYKKSLEDMLGCDKVEELIRLGRTTKKYSKSEIEDLIKHYRDKIKEYENG